MNMSQGSLGKIANRVKFDTINYLLKINSTELLNVDEMSVS